MKNIRSVKDQLHNAVVHFYVPTELSKAAECPHRAMLSLTYDCG